MDLLAFIFGHILKALIKDDLIAKLPKVGNQIVKKYPKSIAAFLIFTLEGIKMLRFLKSYRDLETERNENKPEESI